MEKSKDETVEKEYTVEELKAIIETLTKDIADLTKRFNKLNALYNMLLEQYFNN